MGREYYNFNLLKTRLAEGDNITFVLGSAVTASRNGVGIPNVDGVVSFIENYVDELGLLDDYKDYLKQSNSGNIYQDSFSFISGAKGPKSIQDIVRRVVLSNVDVDGKHGIPKTIKGLVSAIKDKKLKVGNIITTNFDTLIEEQLSAEDVGFNSFSIVSDSNILNANNGLLNIVHMHGVWDKNDTMHTVNQLEAKRSKIESSLKQILNKNFVVVMGYSGWVDSFTRSLAEIMNDDNATYEIVWCFYESEDGIIDRKYQKLFDSLSSAIVRDRVQFYKGVDCEKVFEEFIALSEAPKKKRLSKSAALEVEPEEINFYALDTFSHYRNVRVYEQREALKILNKYQVLFIEAHLGCGLFGFISSLVVPEVNDRFRCIRIDMSDILSKNQIDDRIKSQTNFNANSLIFNMQSRTENSYVLIFEGLRGDIDEDALQYLINIKNLSTKANSDIFFILTSHSDIKYFSEYRVKLDKLSLQDTIIVLDVKFREARFSPVEVSEIYDRSEGGAGKLDRIMYFLEDGSTQEVLSENDIFDTDFYSESIPSTTIKQIDILKADPEKDLTLKMLKILSVIKNGDTLSNLRRDSYGLHLSIKNTKELLLLELATTTYIDSATTIVKVNPIIKDYVISFMSDKEIYEITNAYLKIAIVESKKGIRISSSNRKIYDNGYSSEEDNASSLLRNAISECKSVLDDKLISSDDKSYYEQRLKKLLYLSKAYVYSLSNSARYNETLSAASSLLKIIREIDPENIYHYYAYLAYAHRMKSNTSEAKKFIELGKSLCPDTDKYTTSYLYMEELHLLEKLDPVLATQIAKVRKKEFKKDSPAYILSEQMLLLPKPKSERLTGLVKLEKKARRLGYHTTANNIVFFLNESNDNSKKLDSLNIITRTDPSDFNYCKATIYKNEIYVRSGQIDKITNSDINTLINIYNYLFKQRFDSLFNRCHDLLWNIAEFRNNIDIIKVIFYKGVIVWKLGNDVECMKKYSMLMEKYEDKEVKMLLEYSKVI